MDPTKVPELPVPTEDDVMRAFNAGPPTHYRAPTTSDPVRQFDEQKEKDVAKLLNKVCNSKFYTVEEYREIEADMRKLAGLPPRNYSYKVFKKKAASK